MYLRASRVAVTRGRWARRSAAGTPSAPQPSRDAMRAARSDVNTPPASRIAWRWRAHRLHLVLERHDARNRAENLLGRDDVLVSREKTPALKWPRASAAGRSLARAPPRRVAPSRTPASTWRSTRARCAPETSGPTSVEGSADRRSCRRSWRRAGGGVVAAVCGGRAGGRADGRAGGRADERTSGGRTARQRAPRLSPRRSRSRARRGAPQRRRAPHAAQRARGV